MKTIVWTILAIGFLAPVALAQDMVDNPQYKQWAAFKPGTTSKLQSQSVMTAGGQDVTTKAVITSTLKEVTPEKVVIEVAVDMDSNGTKTSIPARKMDIPAKVAKAATQPASAPGITTTKKGEGDEEIMVAGKKYKAHWVQYLVASDQMESTSKTWTSDEIPGGILKSVTEMTKPMASKTTMELVEFTAGS
jgi:hypothetical protein